MIHTVIWRIYIYTDPGSTNASHGVKAL